MPATAGYLGTVLVGVGTYTPADGVPSWTGETPSLSDPAEWYSVMSLKEADGTVDGKNVDVTTLGVNAVARLHVQVDSKYTLTGFYDETDTTGQDVLWTWLLGLASNPTTAPLMLKYEPTGSASVGWKQCVLPSEIATKVITGDVDQITIQLEGNGPIAQLTA
jgi:hypothetical protein